MVATSASGNPAPPKRTGTSTDKQAFLAQRFEGFGGETRFTVDRIRVACRHLRHAQCRRTPGRFGFDGGERWRGRWRSGILRDGLARLSGRSCCGLRLLEFDHDRRERIDA